jgi:3-phenylpropionate/trans-cinnamate dioxygenase ferredoxin subunit
MADFVEAAGLDQVPPGKSTSVKVAGRDVALFNVDGTIFAMDDTCPHAGASLGLGKLDGKTVTCRSHGMRFDVTTGCFAGTSDSGVASYPVKVVDGTILVAVG